MQQDLEQNSNKQDEDKNQERKIKESFLVSLLTGVVSGLVIDCPGKIELTSSNILLISSVSGVAMPFLLKYDRKSDESLGKTFNKSPYYFTGMLTGLTIARTINLYMRGY